MNSKEKMLEYIDLSKTIDELECFGLSDLAALDKLEAEFSQLMDMALEKVSEFGDEFPIDDWVELNKEYDMHLYSDDGPEEIIIYPIVAGSTDTSVWMKIDYLEDTYKISGGQKVWI